MKKKVLSVGILIALFFGLFGMAVSLDTFHHGNSQITDEEIPLAGSLIDEFGMKDFSNWRSGTYSFTSGAYEPVSARICLNDYQKVKEGKTYTVVCSNTRFHFLIRELDASGKKIGSYNLEDGDSYTIGTGADTIAVSLYDTKNKTKT